MACFAGWDISPEHGAMVVVAADGSLVDWRWYTTSAAALKIPAKDRGRDKGVAAEAVNGYWMRVPKSASTTADKSLSKLAPAAVIFGRWCQIMREHGVSLAILEDYAYGAGGRSYQIAEISAMARLAITMGRTPLRLMEPMTVKIFSGAGGDADKNDVIAKVEQHWPQSRLQRWEDLPRASMEDLNDAAVMANAARIEMSVRLGEVTLKSLPAWQIQALNRATKANPVNALGCDPFVADRCKL